MKVKPAAKAPAQPPARVATAEEITRAIDALTEEESVRLKDYAENRIARIGPRAANRREADELINEAVVRLLEGTRRWYRDNVAFVLYLIGAVRSIASEWAGHRKRNAASPEY